MKFEWDADKDRRNQSKHGITFTEAISVFDSEGTCLELVDHDHSDFEDRFITIGPLSSGLVLVVWTEREHETIRVISARWASPREVALYRAQMELRR